MAKKTKTTEATPTTETAPAKAATKKAPAKKVKPAKEKKLSALDAAATVLGETGEPMTSGELIEAMAKKGQGFAAATAGRQRTVEGILTDIVRVRRHDRRASRRHPCFFTRRRLSPSARTGEFRVSAHAHGSVRSAPMAEMSNAVEPFED
jgi:hypothetical protein